MEPKPPKRKKRSRGTPGTFFPIIETISGPYKFTAKFNGFNVVVDKQFDMEKINSMGSYGKGNLSRNFPVFNKKETILLRKRVYDERNKILEINPDSFKQYDERNVLIVEDSDSEVEVDEYIKNLKPILKKQKISVNESVFLLLEEAYFLMYDKKCLNIFTNDDNMLNEDSAWSLFANAQNMFIANYIVYSHFRTRNWVLKPGLKYGGDFCR